MHSIKHSRKHSRKPSRKHSKKHNKKQKELTIIEDESRIHDEQIEDNEDPEFIGLEVADVVEAVQQLSPAYRQVFNLYVMENYYHKEVADIMGI